jgi:cathepsin X
VDARIREIRAAPGFTVPEHVVSPLPETYIDVRTLPEAFDWSNVSGQNFLARSMNQHIPVYCGGCWLFSGIHSLQDRIKIARKGKGVDINLSLQYVANCGTDVAGSCGAGGTTGGLYQFIHDQGFIPFETCLTWEACSADSTEERCTQGNYTCSPINTCRTCDTYSDRGGKCVAVERFPNATVAEYGTVLGEEKMMAEIFARGPIACPIDATTLLHYKGGIIDNTTPTSDLDHMVSIVGWGVDAASGKKYWRARNSWGEYWGQLGFFQIVRGENQLGIESGCTWVTPGAWSTDNFFCGEDGRGCLN